MKLSINFVIYTLSVLLQSQAQHQQQQQQPKHEVVSNIFERTFKEYHVQAPVVCHRDQHPHHNLYRVSGKPQLQCHGSGCVLRDEANITPKLLDSIKKRVGVINLSPTFFFRPDHNVPERECGATTARVTDVGVLTYNQILTRTSAVHIDHVSETGEVVDGYSDVAFVMLNSNPDAHFQHGEISIPIVEGSLVFFDGRTPHNTVVNSGNVHILGPFEISASWIPGNSVLNFVGDVAPQPVAPKPSSKSPQTPSLAPSVDPSLEPSFKPSSTPSLAPSGDPSLEPSFKPSSTPSLAPSGDPSLEPSFKPSSTPSLAPSGDPSLKPSFSLTPSLAPTDNPSLKPSFKPSSTPSQTPSIAPSDNPSQSPSCKPLEMAAAAVVSASEVLVEATLAATVSAAEAAIATKAVVDAARCGC